ncbi:MAG: glycosyltransferase family 2 protein [Saprospiraceae bacterium]
MWVLAQIIFWGSLAALLHSYVFYPFLMRLFARGKQANVLVFDPTDPELPLVSVLMSVHNEERIIVKKLDNLQRVKYPGGKLHLYVGSDQSDDGTHELVATWIAQNPSANIHFVPFPERRGKPPVINDLAELALADFEKRKPVAGQHLFLLTDASVMLEPETLFQLVRHFKNPKIGVVDAHMRSEGLRQEGISRSEERYLSGEVQLKHWESQAWGMMIGPFGGCYALRADLFEPIPPRSLVDDFWLVFRVLEKGYSAINDLEAQCFEGATHRVADEYRRKKRIAAGSFQNLARFRQWVLPPTSRLGFVFFSHKVLRWFGGFFLLLIFLSAGVLALQNQFFNRLFWLMTCGTAVVLALNFIQIKLQREPWTLVKNLAYFLAMNLALVDGFFKWLRGIREGTWQPTTRE